MPANALLVLCRLHVKLLYSVIFRNIYYLFPLPHSLLFKEPNKIGAVRGGEMISIFGLDDMYVREIGKWYNYPLFDNLQNQ